MNNGSLSSTAQSTKLKGLLGGAGMSIINPTIEGVNSLPPAARLPFIVPKYEPVFFYTQHPTITTCWGNAAGPNMFIRVFEDVEDSTRLTYYSTDLITWNPHTSIYFDNTLDSIFWAGDRFFILGRGPGVNTYLWHFAPTSTSFDWLQATVSIPQYQFSKAAAGSEIAVCYNESNAPSRVLVIKLPYSSTASFSLVTTATAFPGRACTSLRIVPAGTTVVAIVDNTYVYKYVAGTSASTGSFVLTTTVEQVNSLSYSNGNLVELFGKGSVVYVSHDAGYTWSVEQSNLLDQSRSDYATNILKAGSVYVAIDGMLASTDRRAWWYCDPGRLANSQSYSATFSYEFKGDTYTLNTPDTQVGLKLVYPQHATTDNLRPGGSSPYIKLKT